MKAPILLRELGDDTSPGRRTTPALEMISPPQSSRGPGAFHACSTPYTSKYRAWSIHILASRFSTFATNLACNWLHEWSSCLRVRQARPVFANAGLSMQAKKPTLTTKLYPDNVAGARASTFDTKTCMEVTLYRQNRITQSSCEHGLGLDPRVQDELRFLAGQLRNMACR